MLYDVHSLTYEVSALVWIAPQSRPYKKDLSASKFIWEMIPRNTFKGVERWGREEGKPIKSDFMCESPLR